MEGEVGLVRTKLVSMGKWCGIGGGNFDEMSEDTHLLVAAMANCRSWMADPTWGLQGTIQAEEEERYILQLYDGASM